MTQSIAHAIARAQDVASDLGANLPQLPPMPLPMPAVGPSLSLHDMLLGSIEVDHWLKYTEYGIAIGDRTRPLETISVYLNMDEIAYCYQVKYQLNGAAKYHRSYDRLTDARGGAWSATLDQVKQIDPAAFEYRSAELPLILAEDVLGKDGKTIAVRAGETLGLALPTTGWKSFQRFVRGLNRRHIDARTASLRFELGFKVLQKTGVKDWSVPEFSDVEEVDDVPLFEASQ